MDIRFVPPEIRSLELLNQELLLLPLFAEDRPPMGALGLVDYRLAGRVSELIQNGRIEPDLGSAYALPGRPKLGFERIVIVGAGSIVGFDRSVASRVALRMHEAAREVRARRATAELPGRARELISAETAIELWLELARQNASVDTWTLIETGPAAKRMSHLAESEPQRRWGLPSP
jgi:hypothetical protein